MKLTVFFSAIISIVLFSCSKQSTADLKTDGLKSGSLAGGWRMIASIDNSSGAVITKPSSVSGEVDITFSEINTASGTFSGRTPTNDISNSDYATTTNHALTIPFLAMTKVAETPWGKEFVDNIRDANQYNFNSKNDLLIKTINKTLIFQRH